MSQNEGDFQSKPRGGGQKFGGKGRRDRNFGKKPEGDRSERPARSSAPARPFSRDSRPPRDRGAGDNPYKKRDFGGGEPRREYKPEGRRDFGDKKSSYNKEKRYNDRPQKSYARYDERPAKRDFREERAPAHAETRQKLRSERPSYGPPSAAYLYGTHSVTQALLNPKRTHQRLLCTRKAYESIQETWTEALESGIVLPEVVTVEKEDIERLLPRDAVHQDLLLDCRPLEEMPLHDLLLTVPDDAKILVLDQVTDPHNVGAILRSAAAFGALAVVVQTLNAPEVTGTLAKSASGALEHVPLIREVNLSRALEQLKEAGFFCIGLAEGGKQTLAQMKLTGKTALVLGAEGAGLRRLVAENCDELVKLPTREPIASLNVSNAAAVALYELSRN